MATMDKLWTTLTDTANGVTDCGEMAIEDLSHASSGQSNGPREPDGTVSAGTVTASKRRPRTSPSAGGPMELYRLEPRRFPEGDRALRPPPHVFVFAVFCSRVRAAFARAFGGGWLTG